MLVYGYAPSGHSAAAFALEAAGLTAGLSFSRIEIAADYHPAAGFVVARGYHALLSAAPGAWREFYRSIWARSILRAVCGAYLDLGGARRLREDVRRLGAQVVICPQVAVAAVLSQARRCGELDVPVVSVLTDYGVHPFWADPPADLILVPDEAAAAQLAGLGVARARLCVVGIPVHPEFAVAPSREEARRTLALPVAAPVVLLSGGGKGLGGLDRAARALLSASSRAHLLVLCGANDRLRISLSHQAFSARLRVFGPQPPAFVALLMAAADLHVGKPGGLTSAECLASSLPMVLTRPLPGQEEDNARRLEELGAAVACASPQDAASAAARLLDDRCALAALRAATEAAGRPDAATSAVAEIEKIGRRAQK